MARRPLATEGAKWKNGKVSQDPQRYPTGYVKNNPGFVKDSVNEATEVLSGMPNTRKCLLESGVRIQKKIESHPAMKKLGIFQRPRSASLGDTPKNQVMGQKRSALSPLWKNS